MEKQIIDNLKFDGNGDLISVETFVSCPEALAVEEQIALLELSKLFARLQKTSHVKVVNL